MSGDYRLHENVSGSDLASVGNSTGEPNSIMKLGRVVIGIDFSAPSIDAAQWVARWLASGAELVLLHVISVPEAPPIVRSRFPDRELLVDTVRVGAEKRLREISLSLPAARIWPEIREGTPAESLIKVADEFAADLVVAGAHGERQGLAEGLGSTAEHLVRTSTHPVILVTRPRTSRPSHILVAAEKSDATTTALRWAAALSEPLDARVTAIHVVPGSVASSALAATGVTGEQPGVGAPSAMTEAPDPWVERVMSAGVPRARAGSEAAFGDAAREILAASERLEADLVVMGRRAAGNVRRAILGSVVNGVLRGATCPVLVVPE